MIHSEVYSEQVVGMIYFRKVGHICQYRLVFLTNLISIELYKIVSNTNPQIMPLYEAGKSNQSSQQSCTIPAYLVHSSTSIGVMPRILELLNRRHLPKLGFECLWILTNMACGDIAPVQKMQQLGALDLICDLMVTSSNEEVLEQCLVSPHHHSSN